MSRKIAKSLTPATDVRSPTLVELRHAALRTALQKVVEARTYEIAQGWANVVSTLAGAGVV